MTNYRAPFSIITVPDEPTVAFTTVADVSARGGPADAAGLALNASSRFTRNVSVSGNIQAGAVGQLGSIVLTQSATVTEAMTAATQLLSLPNANILDIVYKRVNAGGFSTAAATVNILVGTSADDDEFGSFPNVSAQPVLSLTEDGTGVCGKNLQGFTTQGLFVKVTAASGAVSANLGVGLLAAIYNQR